MELSKNQIQQIHTFIKNKGVAWYDVRVEIVDHFANAIETNLNDNSKLTFDEALHKIYSDFNDVKFKKLINEKNNLLSKRTLKAIKNYFVSYFSFPKILIILLLLTTLNFLFNFTEDKNMFINSLAIILLLFGFYMFIKALNIIHLKYHFLALESIRSIGLGVNVFAIIFNTMHIFTKNIHAIEFYRFKIFVFVFFIVIISAMIHVYNRMTDEIQNQYPEIKII